MVEQEGTASEPGNEPEQSPPNATGTSGNNMPNTTPPPKQGFWRDPWEWFDRVTKKSKLRQALYTAAAVIALMVIGALYRKVIGITAVDLILLLKGSVIIIVIIGLVLLTQTLTIKDDGFKKWIARILSIILILALLATLFIIFIPNFEEKDEITTTAIRIFRSANDSLPMRGGSIRIEFTSNSELEPIDRENYDGKIEIDFSPKQMASKFNLYVGSREDVLKPIEGFNPYFAPNCSFRTDSTVIKVHLVPIDTTQIHISLLNSSMVGFQQILNKKLIVKSAATEQVFYRESITMPKCTIVIQDTELAKIDSLEVMIDNSAGEIQYRLMPNVFSSKVKSLELTAAVDFPQSDIRIFFTPSHKQMRQTAELVLSDIMTQLCSDCDTSKKSERSLLSSNEVRIEYGGDVKPYIDLIKNIIAKQSSVQPTQIKSELNAAEANNVKIYLPCNAIQNLYDSCPVILKGFVKYRNGSPASDITVTQNKDRQEEITNNKGKFEMVFQNKISETGFFVFYFTDGIKRDTSLPQPFSTEMPLITDLN